MLTMGRRHRKSVAVIAGAVAGCLLSAFPASLQATAPLMSDFMGMNGHWTPDNQIGFSGAVYGPTTGNVRDYHPVSWDVGSNTSTTTKFPLGNGGWPNWNTDKFGYAQDVAAGVKVDLDIQFDPISPGSWTNMAADSNKYGKEVASYFGSPSIGGTGLASSFEIGNEPGNYSDAQFTTVFQNMAQGIRSVDPTTPIVTCNVNLGSTSGSYSKSVELFKPMLNLVDVLAIHTYPFLNYWPTYTKSYPEDTRMPYLSDVQGLINWRNTNAPGKQVWVTEFGYDASSQPTGTPSNQFTDVTDTQQAQYLTRSYMAFSKMGVDRAYVYYFNDDDTPSLHASSGVTRNGVPKPSFYALAHLKKTLGNYRFTSTIRETQGSLFIYAYSKNTDPNDVYWVMWSATGSNQTIPVALATNTLPGSVVSAEQMPLAAGSAPLVPYSIVNNQLQLTVGESPVYVHMVAVPEPGALALLGTAVCMLVGRRRQPESD